MRIRIENTAALVIDIQEKLLPHIHNHEQLLVNTRKLLEGLNVLELPVIYTEQYKKGLGDTVPAIRELLAGKEPVEKMSFSCCEEDRFMAALNKINRKNVIICGIEAHVCVQQTVIDLAENGYTPVVIVNCISSRREEDKHAAIERMKAEGSLIATYESILFELTRLSGTDQFRAISRIIK